MELGDQVKEACKRAYEAGLWDAVCRYAQDELNWWSWRPPLENVLSQRENWFQQWPENCLSLMTHINSLLDGSPLAELLDIFR